MSHICTYRNLNCINMINFIKIRFKIINFFFVAFFRMHKKCIVDYYMYFMGMYAILSLIMKNAACAPVSYNMNDSFLPPTITITRFQVYTVWLVYFYLLSKLPSNAVAWKAITTWRFRNVQIIIKLHQWVPRYYHRSIKWYYVTLYNLVSTVI